MRPGLLALSAVCFLAVPAVAQPPAAGPDIPLPMLTAPADGTFQNTITNAIAEDPGTGPRAWASIEYLRWWITNSNSPELIQTVPSDQVVLSGTGNLPPGAAQRFFPSDRDVQFGAFNGIRPTIGFTTDSIGFEISGFWLDQKSVTGAVASDGTPFAVAQQYTAAGSNRVISLFASLAGQYSGGAQASTDVRLWGFDANVRTPTYRMLADWNHCLVGFRYFNLEENLNVGSNATFPSGGRFVIEDSIRTRNEFYGGQVGLASRYGGLERGFGLDGLFKMAVGGVRQHADLNGSNTAISPTGERDSVPGGLYVQPSNAGTYERTKVAMLVEYNLNLTYNFNPNWQFVVGYSINYLTSAVRPAELIDPVLNDSRIRYVATPSSSDADSPRFTWRASDFWTQGVNVGLRFQY